MSLGYSKQAVSHLRRANDLIIKEQYQDALTYLKIPLSEGIPNAQTNMGTLHYNGFGVDKDPTKAVYWYHIAAKKGCKTALFNLGLCYKEGFGVTVDSSRAIRLFEHSAELGYAPAEYQLGHAYKLGLSVEKSQIKAIIWFKRAADQGYANAQYSLGKMFYDNAYAPDVTRDLVKAHLYASLAAKNGQEKAGQLLDIIEDEMTEKQCELATRLLNKWGKSFSRGVGYVREATPESVEA